MSRSSMMSVILRARDKMREKFPQVGECPICALCALFSRESDKRHMKERDDAFERVRLQLERAWPKLILPSPHSSSSADEKSSSVGNDNAAPLETTPLRAMETNMEMVLKTLTTSSLFFEEEEEKKTTTTTTTTTRGGGLRDDAKTLEKLLEEMKRHNEEDVEIAASTGARFLEEGNIEEDEEEAKCRIEKFLLGTPLTRGVPKRGVAVKMVSSSSEEEKTLMSKGDVRVHVVDRSTAGWSRENNETDDDAWMEDAIELIERAKKSNARAFVVVENCETEEKAREIASEMYSGAMAFSANRKEEDEFVFCLEGQMYLETDETRAMTGVTERRDNTKGSGLFALGSESDSNDDDNNDAEKRDTSNINNKEDKATTTTTKAAAAAIGLAQNVNDIATCARAQTNIANAIREVCLERAERYALEYQPIRDRIYVKLKEKAKAKNAAKKQKENKGFDVSNDEPVRMSANASSPLVKNDQIKNNNDLMVKKEGGGVMSFLEWIGDEEVDLPANEQKGISYQSKADAARIKSLEAALRELQPDHPLLMFCPPPPKT